MKILKWVLGFLAVLAFCLIGSIHSWGWTFHFKEMGVSPPPSKPATYLYLWTVADEYPPMAPIVLESGMTFEVMAELREITVVPFYGDNAKGTLQNVTWNLRKMTLSED